MFPAKGRAFFYREKLILRAVSTLLLAAFFCQDMAWAAPTSPASYIQQAQTGGLGSILRNPGLFNFPDSQVRLEEVYDAGETSPIVVHIQDPHANFSGQQNLAEILKKLSQSYGLKTVMVEGGEGDVTLTPLREAIPEGLRKIKAKSLLMSAEIAGEEYLNLCSNLDIRLIGAEDLPLYFQSIRDYAALAGKRDEILGFLSKVSSAVEKIKRKSYPATILEYENILSSSDKNTHSRRIEKLSALAGPDKLARYATLAKLSSLKQDEARLDFEKVNLEREVLRLSEPKALEGDLTPAQSAKYPNLAAYQAYARNVKRMDFNAVVDEIELLEQDVYRALLKDSDARMLRAIDRYIGLLSAAYQIRMSSREFSSLLANEPDFSSAQYLGFINRKLAEAGYVEELLPMDFAVKEGRQALDDFYRSVDARDEAFLKNLEKKAAPGEPVALIAGGYHTQHIKELLKKKGYSYLVLSPVVTQETNWARYENVLLEPLKDAPKNSITIGGDANNRYQTARPASAVYRSVGARLVDLAAEPNRPNLKKWLEQNRQVAADARSGARLAGQGLREVLRSEFPDIAQNIPDSQLQQMILGNVTVAMLKSMLGQKWAKKANLSWSEDQLPRLIQIVATFKDSQNKAFKKPEAISALPDSGLAEGIKAQPAQKKFPARPMIMVAGIAALLAVLSVSYFWLFASAAIVGIYSAHNHFQDALGAGAVLERELAALPPAGAVLVFELGGVDMYDLLSHPTVRSAGITTKVFASGNLNPTQKMLLKEAFNENMQAQVRALRAGFFEGSTYGLDPFVGGVVEAALRQRKKVYAVHVEGDSRFSYTAGEFDRFFESAMKFDRGNILRDELIFSLMDQKTSPEDFLNQAKKISLMRVESSAERDKIFSEALARFSVENPGKKVLFLRGSNHLTDGTIRSQLGGQIREEGSAANLTQPRPLDEAEREIARTGSADSKIVEDLLLRQVVYDSLVTAVLRLPKKDPRYIPTDEALSHIITRVTVEDAKAMIEAFPAFKPKNGRRAPFYEAAFNWLVPRHPEIGAYSHLFQGGARLADADDSQEDGFRVDVFERANQIVVGINSGSFAIDIAGKDVSDKINYYASKLNELAVRMGLSQEQFLAKPGGGGSLLLVASGKKFYIENPNRRLSLMDEIRFALDHAFKKKNEKFLESIDIEAVSKMAKEILHTTFDNFNQPVVDRAHHLIDLSKPVLEAIYDHRINGADKKFRPFTLSAVVAAELAKMAIEIMATTEEESEWTPQTATEATYSVLDAFDYAANNLILAAIYPRGAIAADGEAVDFEREDHPGDIIIGQREDVYFLAVYLARLLITSKKSQWPSVVEDYIRQYNGVREDDIQADGLLARIAYDHELSRPEARALIEKIAKLEAEKYPGEIGRISGRTTVVLTGILLDLESTISDVLKSFRRLDSGSSALVWAYLTEGDMAGPKFYGRKIFSSAALYGKVYSIVNGMKLPNSLGEGREIISAMITSAVLRSSKAVSVKDGARLAERNRSGFNVASGSMTSSEKTYQALLEEHLNHPNLEREEKKALINALVRSKDGFLKLRQPFFFTEEESLSILEYSLFDLKPFLERVIDQKKRYQSKTNDKNKPFFSPKEIQALLFQKLIPIEWIEDLIKEGLSKAVATRIVTGWSKPIEAWNNTLKPIRDELVREGLSAAYAIRIVTTWSNPKEKWDDTLKPIRDELVTEGLSKRVATFIVTGWSNPKEAWNETLKPIRDELVAEGISVSDATTIVTGWSNPKEKWNDTLKPIRDELVTEGLSKRVATTIVTGWSNPKETWNETLKPIRDELVREGLSTTEATRIVTGWSNPKETWHDTLKPIRDELVAEGLSRSAATTIVTHWSNPEEKWAYIKSISTTLAKRTGLSDFVVRQLLLTQSHSSLIQILTLDHGLSLEESESILKPLVEQPDQPTPDSESFAQAGARLTTQRFKVVYDVDKIIENNLASPEQIKLISPESIKLIARVIMAHATKRTDKKIGLNLTPFQMLSNNDANTRFNGIIEAQLLVNGNAQVRFVDVSLQGGLVGTLEITAKALEQANEENRAWREMSDKAVEVELGRLKEQAASEAALFAEDQRLQRLAAKIYEQFSEKAQQPGAEGYHLSKSVYLDIVTNKALPIEVVRFYASLEPAIRRIAGDNVYLRFAVWDSDGALRGYGASSDEKFEMLDSSVARVVIGDSQMKELAAMLKAGFANIPNFETAGEKEIDLIPLVSLAVFNIMLARSDNAQAHKDLEEQLWKNLRENKTTELFNPIGDTIVRSALKTASLTLEASIYKQQLGFHKLGRLPLDRLMAGARLTSAVTGASA